MTYRGETPGKKLARLRYWEGVKNVMGKRFYTSHHLVLLSAQAGDVSVLLGLGVDPQFIIGVDHDKHATAAAKHKFYRSACILGDVAQVVEELADDGTKLGSIYLDFCSQMCELTWSRVNAVLPHLTRGAVFGCAFLACREQTEWKEEIRQLKQEPGYDSFKTRAWLIDRDLKAECKRLKKTIATQEFVHYASHGTDRYGKPMIICRAVIGAKQSKARYYKLEASPTDLGKKAMKLERAGKSAELLLNAPPHSVSAWRAHATRGTYGK